MRGQERPGEARRGQERPGEARRSQERPEEARKGQERPGEASSMLLGRRNAKTGRRTFRIAQPTS